MRGFHALRPSKPLDFDSGTQAAAQSDCHKMVKICKTIPFKRLTSALNFYQKIKKHIKFFKKAY